MPHEQEHFGELVCLLPYHLEHECDSPDFLTIYPGGGLGAFKINTIGDFPDFLNIHPDMGTTLKISKHPEIIHNLWEKNKLDPAKIIWTGETLTGPSEKLTGPGRN